MAAKKQIACANAGFMLRFLPYSDRAPYPSRRMAGRYEECFATQADARDRFRQLRKERRIEDAEIVRSAGAGTTATVVKWEDRLPRKWHKRR